MVDDDPSTAQDVWKATMGVTKSCCCKELEMKWREGGGFSDRALGRCHVDWAVHVFLEPFHSENLHVDTIYYMIS
jgi:hypothetical protein